MKLIYLVIFLTIFGGIIYAHPPTKIDISYDTETKLLTISIEHDVSISPPKDPERHYINYISVSVNGKNAITETLYKQESVMGEVVVFKLILKSGDKISIKAVCNITGSLSKVFYIP